MPIEHELTATQAENDACETYWPLEQHTFWLDMDISTLCEPLLVQYVCLNHTVNWVVTSDVYGHWLERHTDTQRRVVFLQLQLRAWWSL
jgi:hypothetical protein